MRPIIPFLISCAIVLHHYKNHYNDDRLTLIEKFVQFDDINNHETWALFFLGISIGMKIKRTNLI